MECPVTLHTSSTPIIQVAQPFAEVIMALKYSPGNSADCIPVRG